MEPFAATVDIALQEELRPTIDVITGVSLHDTGEEATMIDESHIIDLTEVVGQNLLPALPMRPSAALIVLGCAPNAGRTSTRGRADVKGPLAIPAWRF